MKRIEAISHVIKELKTLKEELGSGKSISTLDFLRLSEVFKFQIEPKSDRFTAVCLDEAAKIQDDEKHLKMIDDILRDELDGDDSDDSDDSEVEEVTELLDFDGSIQSSKIPPGADNVKTLSSRKTTDDVVRATRQAGSWTGAGHYFKRYYGESIEELGEHDMSEVLGFEDTEFKDAEETIEYFEKEHDMDEIEATERAESMGKTSGLDKKGQQRLTEKERLKKLSEDKAKNMIEVLLSKKEEGREISSGQNSLLDIKIKQLFKLASVEGVSQEELLKKIKSFNE
jgi:hypothetical protein|tara:strand:+ start:929 stop:1783 length:855 start_codon:yes stop_codon:yes gene_type:complete